MAIVFLDELDESSYFACIRVMRQKFQFPEVVEYPPICPKCQPNILYYVGKIELCDKHKAKPSEEKGQENASIL